MTDTVSEITQWVRDLAGDPDGDWHEKTPGGTRERPYVVEGVRRVTLVRTDANEWGVICHGGWTESPPGKPIGKFTANYGPADFYATEDEARAAYLLDGGIDRAELVRIVAAGLAARKESTP